MIIDDKRVPTVVNGTITESFFTVKQENLAHIFSILRNSLYSDKAGAIIREYSTNAYDAHVQAGIEETPITINCPTRFNPLLSIRDYGFGLSEEDIFNVFASYGESTKRNTNDQVGMMGLGCKSAFSYTDSFTIISHHGGMQKNYLAYIDDTGIGKVMKVEEKPSSERGVEIQVPVNSYECYMFENAIVKQLQFFKPKPVVNLPHIQRDMEFSRFKVEISGNGYDIIKSYDSNFVVMGNVAYPFESETFNNHPQYQEAMRMVAEYSQKIVLYAEIGDVIPSASRESLDLREKTITWIGEALINASKDIRGNLFNKLDICDTMWEAKCFYHTLSLRYQNLLSGYTKEGVRLSNSSIEIPKIKGITVRTNSDDKLVTANHITCTYNTLVFVSKGDVTSASIKKRIKQHCDMAVNCYAVECPDVETYNEFINHPDMQGATFVDLASIELPKIQRTRGQVKTHDAYAFKNFGSNTARECWYKTSLDFKNGSGIYVLISNYTVANMSTWTLSRIQHILKTFGHDIVLYGIRESDANKLGSGWKHLRTILQESVDSITQDVRDKVSIAYVNQHISKETRFLYQTFADLDDDPFGFKSICDLSTHSYDTNEVLSNICTLVNIGIKYDLSNESKMVLDMNSLKQKYPLLQYIEVHNNSIPHIVEYIKAMNK